MNLKILNILNTVLVKRLGYFEYSEDERVARFWSKDLENANQEYILHWM